MDRRLKDRVAPAAWAKVKQIPKLLLLVTAAITITPEAMARVLNHEAEAVFTKVYSKDELKKTMPANPVANLGDRLVVEVTEMFKNIAAQQRGYVPTLDGLKSREPDKNTWLIQQAAFKNAPKPIDSNSTAVRTYFAGSGQRAASGRFRGHFSFLNRFTSGASVNLDLSSAFDTKSDVKPSEGNVRYGLVLQDIVPARAAVDRAALGETETSELQFAGHADVHWTIGPISEAHGRKLFMFQEAQEQASEPAAPRTGVSGFFFGLLDRIKIPKLAMGTRVRPENLDNLATVKKENMPTWRVDAYQVEDFASVTYQMKSTGEKIVQEQEFRVPIGGNAKLGRRFTDNWKVVQTSAYNVLFDQRLPLVSVHYMHIEERYKGTVGFPLSPGATLSVTAQGKAFGPLAPGSTPNESYGIDLTKSF